MSYEFDFNKFKEATLGKVNGTDINLQISRIKVGSKISPEIIKLLNEANSNYPQVVMKINDEFIIEGYALGTFQRTLVHTVIIKSENNEYVRGTRADNVFISFKVENELLGLEKNYL